VRHKLPVVGRCPASLHVLRSGTFSLLPTGSPDVVRQVTDEDGARARFPRAAPNPRYDAVLNNF